MLGYDMTWAAFRVLDVMSSGKLVHKFIGYMAAVQSFQMRTDVLLLVENLLNKDLISTHPDIASISVTAIPHLITPNMASSLFSRVCPRLKQSKANIRQKYIVALYSIACINNDLFSKAWNVLCELLMSEIETSPLMATIVNVVCELAVSQPLSVLPIVPRLYEILIQSGNNWMSIKIFKLFAMLIPLEPRLVKKILPIVTMTLNTTSAMSLQFECINCIITGGVLEKIGVESDRQRISELCMDKLSSMLSSEADPNLRYVALQAIGNLAQYKVDLVRDYNQYILDCLGTADISIQLSAMNFVGELITRRNFRQFIDRMTDQLLETADKDFGNASWKGLTSSSTTKLILLGETNMKMQQNIATYSKYSDYFIRKILNICARKNYEDIEDFEWYIDTLVKLIRSMPVQPRTFTDEENGHMTRDVSYDIGRQLVDVTVRVAQVREYAVTTVENLLLNGFDNTTSTRRLNKLGIMDAVAWIVGEYAQMLNSPSDVLLELLDEEIQGIQSRTMCLYIQAIPKIFVEIVRRMPGKWFDTDAARLTLMSGRVCYRLQCLRNNDDLEVRIRASEFVQVFSMLTKCLETRQSEEYDDWEKVSQCYINLLQSFFSDHDIRPVSKSTQMLIPELEGVDDGSNDDKTINADIKSEVAGGTSVHITKKPNAVVKWYKIREEGSSRRAENPWCKIADSSTMMWEKLNEGVGRCESENGGYQSELLKQTYRKVEELKSGVKKVYEVAKDDKYNEKVSKMVKRDEKDEEDLLHELELVRLAMEREKLKVKVEGNDKVEIEGKKKRKKYKNGKNGGNDGTEVSIAEKIRSEE